MTETPFLDALFGKRCPVCGERLKHPRHAAKHEELEMLLSSGAKPEASFSATGVDTEAVKTLTKSLLAQMNADIEQAMFAPKPLALAMSGISTFGGNGGNSALAGLQKDMGQFGNYTVVGGGGGWEPQGITFAGGGGGGGMAPGTWTAGPSFSYGASMSGMWSPSTPVATKPVAPVEPKVEAEPGIRQIDLEE